MYVVVVWAHSQRKNLWMEFVIIYTKPVFFARIDSRKITFKTYKKI